MSPRLRNIILIGLLVLVPVTTHAAAFTSTDDFESYSTGSVNGDNGGSGWGGAYSVAGGTCNVSTTVAHGGTKSLHFTNTSPGNCDVSRSMTAGTTGTQCFYVYAASTPTGTLGWFPALFKDGATIRFYIGWGVSGSTGNNIGISGDGATYTNIASSPSGATWHQICVDFDQANGRARANIDGGAYTSYVTTSGGSYTQIDSWRWTTADAPAVDSGYYEDDIAPGVTTLATPILSLVRGFWIN